MIIGKNYDIDVKIIDEIKGKLDNRTYDINNGEIANCLNVFLELQHISFKDNDCSSKDLPSNEMIDTAVATASNEGMYEILAGIYFCAGKIFENEKNYAASKEFYIQSVIALKKLYQNNKTAYAPYLIQSFINAVRVDVEKGMDSQSSLFNIITCLEEMSDIDYNNYIDYLIYAYYKYYLLFPKERADMFDIAFMLAQENPERLSSIEVIKKYKIKYPFAHTREKRLIQARVDRKDIKNLDNYD